jgi:hypothetical protein
MHYRRMVADRFAPIVAEVQKGGKDVVDSLMRGDVDAAIDKANVLTSETIAEAKEAVKALAKDTASVAVENLPAVLGLPPLTVTPETRKDIPKIPTVLPSPAVVVTTTLPLTPIVYEEPSVPSAEPSPSSTTPPLIEEPAPLVGPDAAEFTPEVPPVPDTAVPAAIVSPPTPDALMSEGAEQAVQRDSLRLLALRLKDHLESTNANFGVKNAPNPLVAKFERAANLLPPTGIVGPDVRAAARGVGIILPVRREGAVGEKLSTSEIEAVLAAATQPSATTIQGKNAQSAELASAQASMGLAPTGVMDAQTVQAAGMLGITPETIVSTEGAGTHDAFGQHACGSLPSGFDTLRDAIASAVSARPDYAALAHVANCPMPLTANLLDATKASWAYTRKLNSKHEDGSPKFAYGPFALVDDTADWLYGQRRLLGPFSAALGSYSAVTSSGAAPNPIKQKAITRPSTGPWWLLLFLMTLNDVLRTHFDLEGMARSGLLLLKPSGNSATVAHAESANALSTYVNGALRRHPTLDAWTILLALYRQASSLRGMAKAATDDVSFTLPKRLALLTPATAEIATPTAVGVTMV